MDDMSGPYSMLDFIIENCRCSLKFFGPNLRGVVYALDGPLFTPYERKTKIGYTRSLVHRLPQIMADVGDDVAVVGLVWTDDPPYLEARLHDLWANQRARVPRGHEWFDLTKQQLQWFGALGVVSAEMIQGYIEEPQVLQELIEIVEGRNANLP